MRVVGDCSQVGPHDCAEQGRWWRERDRDRRCDTEIGGQNDVSIIDGSGAVGHISVPVRSGHKAGCECISHVLQGLTELNPTPPFCPSTE